MNSFFLKPSSEEGRSQREFYYFNTRGLEAVRVGPWKLRLQSNELFHLKDDIGEENNVAAKHPEVVKKLQNAAKSYEAKTKKSGHALWSSASSQM